MTGISWPAIVTIANTLATDHAMHYGPPTLRRVHYLLVSSPEARSLGYVNTLGCYKTLSDRTARAREAGECIDFVDTVRSIEYPDGFLSAAGAAMTIGSRFTYNRAQHLPRGLVLIAEKAGIVPVLESRYSWLPITSVRGYSSLSHATRISELLAAYSDPIALYVGDYDPTGLDIDRDLSTRLPFPLHRVALSAEQVAEYELPPAPAKSGDSRTASMIAAHGAAMQVELDALPAAVLLDLVGQAIEAQTGATLTPEGGLALPELDEAEVRVRAMFRDLSTALRAEEL